MNTTANVKKVAFLFFLAFMGTHLLTTLLTSNGYAWTILPILRNSLDLPALISGILYAFASMKLYFEEAGKKTELFDLIAGIVGGVLLVGAVVVDFFIN